MGSSRLGWMVAIAAAAALVAACSDGGVTDTGTTAAAKCTTGIAWTYGDEAVPFMHPGVDCIACHATNAGPDYNIAGTVMPTLNEPDDCYGIENVTVRITDAEGTVIELVTNRAGNFFVQRALVTPFTAEVEYDGQINAMVTPQTETNCASCHTAVGANAAPGRIVLSL